MLYKICDRIEYLITKKSGIADSINHDFGNIRIESYNSLPIEKILTFRNVIIHLKSVAKSLNGDIKKVTRIS